MCRKGSWAFPPVAIITHNKTRLQDKLFLIMNFFSSDLKMIQGTQDTSFVFCETTVNYFLYNTVFTANKDFCQYIA